MDIPQFISSLFQYVTYSFCFTIGPYQSCLMSNLSWCCTNVSACELKQPRNNCSLLEGPGEGDTVIQLITIMQLNSGVCKYIFCNVTHANSSLMNQTPIRLSGTLTQYFRKVSVCRVMTDSAQYVYVPSQTLMLFHVEPFQLHPIRYIRDRNRYMRNCCQRDLGACHHFRHCPHGRLHTIEQICHATLQGARYTSRVEYSTLHKIGHASTA